MSGGPRYKRRYEGQRSETTQVRSLARWKRVRRAAIERDGYRCRACGKAAGRFEVDHLVPIAAGGAPFDLENCQTLCRPCHFDKTTLDRGGISHVPDVAWERLVEEAMHV